MMHRRTTRTLATLAAAFWAVAVVALAYAIKVNAPRTPIVSFFAVAGSMCFLAWLNLSLYRLVRAGHTADTAAPARPPEPTADDGDDVDNSNAPTVPIYRTGRRQSPRPRTYSCNPDGELSSYRTVEMMMATEAADKIAKAYSIGDANGYDRAVADMAGVRLHGDDTRYDEAS